MRSPVLLTLSFTLLSTVRAVSPCVSICMLSEAPLECMGDVTCACEGRRFIDRLLVCVRSLCDDDDEYEARTICSSAGPTGTTNTNTLTQPSNTTAANTPSDTQVANTPTTLATLTSTPPTQTNTTTRTGTINPRSASTAGALRAAFVYPRDKRINYTPANSWIDASEESGCSNGARSSSSIGSAISFTFTGTAIWFFTLPLSTSGNWSVKIDNLPAQTISGTNSQFTNPNGCNAFNSYQTEGLTNGQHTFTAKILTSGSVKRTAISTMYFAALKYQGAGATLTPLVTGSSDPGPAYKGGVAGGAIGVIAMSALAICIIRKAYHSAYISPLNPAGTMYRDISGLFLGNWKHPGPVPTVRYIYQIRPSLVVKEQYKAYRNEVDVSPGFQRLPGMWPGNERRRWHGTSRTCALGDNPDNISFCRAAGCALCSILRSTLRVPKSARRGWERFGLGIYTSSTSSKADTYSTNDQSAPSGLKALILMKVVVGKGFKSTSNRQSLTGPPAGYHSVLGEVGRVLNYDELVVYRSDATCPSHLVIYGDA